MAFYCSTIESVLTYCLTVWYGAWSGADNKSSTEGHKERTEYHWLPSLLTTGHCKHSVSVQSNTLLRTPLAPVIFCFPSYLLEGDTGQLKQAQTYLQIVLSKSHSVPELRDALHYLQYLRQSLWTVQSFLYLELHFIVLPALFTFFTWIWLRIVVYMYVVIVIL